MRIERHSIVLALLITVVGLFVGFEIRQFADARGWEHPVGLALAGTGLVWAALDIALRAAFSDQSWKRRLLLPSAGPNIRFIPVWMLGVLVAVAGLLADA